MKILKTTTATLLTSIAIGVFAACGTAPTTPSTSSGATTAPAAPADAATAAPAANTSGEKTKVTIMTWESNETNAAIDAAVATFEAANPTIDVERLETPNTNYGDKIQAMVQANELPDLFWSGNDTEQQFGADGLLFDWSQYAKQTNTESFRLNDFAPGAIENWTSADGKLYGLPTLMNTYGFWYNADLLTEAGVELPKPGWTYEQFYAAAAAATQKDGTNVTRYGMWDGSGFSSPFTMGNCSVSAGGAPFMDKIINPTVVTADAEYTKCVQQLATAVQAGSITPPGYPMDGATESFIAGQIPMLFYGQWLAPSFIEAEPSFTYGFAPLPIVKDVVQPYDAIGLVSPKTIQNPDAVWRVMQFLATDLWKTVLVDAPVAPAAHIPSSEPYFQKLQDAGLVSVAEGVRYELEAPVKQGIRFTAPWGSKANDVVTANWNDMLLGKKPIDTTLPSMVEQINGVITAGG